MRKKAGTHVNGFDNKPLKIITKDFAVMETPMQKPQNIEIDPKYFAAFTAQYIEFLNRRFAMQLNSQNPIKHSQKQKVKSSSKEKSFAQLTPEKKLQKEVEMKSIRQRLENKLKRMAVPESIQDNKRHCMDMENSPQLPGLGMLALDPTQKKPFDNPQLETSSPATFFNHPMFLSMMASAKSYSAGSDPNSSLSNFFEEQHRASLQLNPMINGQMTAESIGSFFANPIQSPSLNQNTPLSAFKFSKSNSDALILAMTSNETGVTSREGSIDWSKFAPE